MAHHIMVMKEGRFVESGPALQLLANPQHEYTRTLLLSA
jgi:peptide/nickel transport system ATP-binding protein